MAGTQRFRLHDDEAVVIFMDYESSVSARAENGDSDVLRNNVLTLARVADDHDLPAILTTRVGHGFNDHLMRDLSRTFPDAPFVVRSGRVDAWDSDEFVASIKATGRTQIILAGVGAEDLATFALSAISDGFHVVVATDACATACVSAWERLSSVGAHLMDGFDVVAALQRQGRPEKEWPTPRRPQIRPFPLNGVGLTDDRRAQGGSALVRPQISKPGRRLVPFSWHMRALSERLWARSQPLWNTL